MFYFFLGQMLAHSIQIPFISEVPDHLIAARNWHLKGFSYWHFKKLGSISTKRSCNYQNYPFKLYLILAKKPEKGLSKLPFISYMAKTCEKVKIRWPSQASPKFTKCHGLLKQGSSTDIKAIAILSLFALPWFFLFFIIS